MKIPSNEEEYLKEFEKFKATHPIGTKVKVLIATNYQYEGGWKNTWVDSMNQYIGKELTISNYDSYNVQLKEGGWNYPYFVLSEAKRDISTLKDTEAIWCKTQEEWDRIVEALIEKSEIRTWKKYWENYRSESCINRNASTNYCLYADKMHWENVRQKTIIESTEFSTQTTNMQTQTISRKNAQKIYEIVCSDWQRQIDKIMREASPFSDMIEVPQSVIDTGYEAANEGQKSLINKYFTVNKLFTSDQLKVGEVMVVEDNNAYNGHYLSRIHGHIIVSLTDRSQTWENNPKIKGRKLLPGETITIKIT